MIHVDVPADERDEHAEDPERGGSAPDDESLPHIISTLNVSPHHARSAQHSLISDIMSKPLLCAPPERSSRLLPHKRGLPPLTGGKSIPDADDGENV